MKIEKPKPKSNPFNVQLSNGTKIEIIKKEDPPVKEPIPEPIKPIEKKVEPEAIKEPVKPSKSNSQEKIIEKKDLSKPTKSNSKEKLEERPKKEIIKSNSKEKLEEKPKKELPKSESKEENEEKFEEEEEEFKGEIMEETKKKHLNIVFIGHVDAGKSTLCGHVLFQAGCVDPRIVEQYQQEAAKIGRGSWYWSWVMDLSNEEREKGKTQEVGVAHFESEVNKYTILDAPGHRSYVPQMIGGAVQADIAVLVVSARAGEFESGFEKGGQTSEHLLIAKTAGVRFVVVAINKMDDSTVNWSKQRYDQIISTLTPYMTKEIGFRPNQFQFIPIAALTGYNLKVHSPECNWYNGPTLFSALDQVPLPPRNENDSFRLPVIDRYKTKSLVCSGKLEKGIIKEGQTVKILPSGARGLISGLYVEETKIRTAVPGDNIRVYLRQIELADLQAGSVICPENKPCSVNDKVLAKIRLTSFAPPVLMAGFEAVCHIHTETVPVSIEYIHEAYISQTQIEKKPKLLRPGQTATVIMKFSRPICVEKFSDFPQLGRFIIRKESYTVIVGVVERFSEDFIFLLQNKTEKAKIEKDGNKFETPLYKIATWNSLNSDLEHPSKRFPEFNILKTFLINEKPTELFIKSKIKFSTIFPLYKHETHKQTYSINPNYLPIIDNLLADINTWDELLLLSEKTF